MDQPAKSVSPPKNAIVILLDSLNRHMLGAYGGAEFDTPNLDRFAQRAVRFDKHYAGSLPCMPARHDILVGALDFLWRPWGSIEIWEEPLTAPLRRNGVTTYLVSDHPHLFETGGENYHTEFTAWDYERGHEGDPWKTRPDPSWAGAPSFRRPWMPYDNSRGYFRGEEEFPGPKVMRAAAEWLDRDAPHHDRFFLFIDEFDPHEPFDTPEPYASMYDPGWKEPHLIWPPYVVGGVRQGFIDERSARQLRASYGAKLTMIDRWLGNVLAAIDKHNFWEDTAVILCTDHGHYLGEKDIFGKPASAVFEPLGHIPLMVAWPGVDPGVVTSLTATVDIFATLCDLFDVDVGQRTHGRSLVPLITGKAKSVREHALCGIWGRDVQLIDERYKYSRAPAGDNAPISMWSNRWSTMPTHGVDMRLPLPDDRAFLDRMPGSNVPVIRQPWQAGDLLPFWGMGQFRGNYLFDVSVDPAEEENLKDSKREREYAHNLRDALLAVDAPDDQLLRLGLE